MKSILPDSSAFHRGKEARSRGLPCVNMDGRLAPSSRQDWISGWLHQDKLMAPRPSDEAIAEHNAFLRGLAKEVRASI